MYPKVKPNLLWDFKYINNVWEAWEILEGMKKDDLGT